MITEEQIRAALKNVIDPKTKTDVISAGLISGIVVREGKVGFMILISPEDREIRAPLQDSCRKAVEVLPEVSHVTAVLTADVSSPGEPPSEQRKKMAQWNLSPVDGVKRIIVIASGKGGVGKSTTAVNLARAAAEAGKKVGILDADIYGPSVPRMLGLRGVRPSVDNHTFIPPEKDGIQAMSIGFLMGEEAAVLRGPMITKTLIQLLRATAWGSYKPKEINSQPLDLLFIDLPPGTGDIHLSLVQQAPIAMNGGGAIIVTTPQEVALDDARKCAQMFRKVDVPILGVIENMSWFEDPSGRKHHLFGQGGGKKLSTGLNVPFLAEIPQKIEIQQAMEEGSNAVEKEYNRVIAALD